MSTLTARWLGLSATTLLAVSAYLAGRPQPHDAAWVLGVVVWFLGLALLGTAWWTLRGETDRGRMLRTGALWSAPLLLAPPLGSHDSYAYGCQGQLFNAGFNLYRVGPSALPCSWLDRVPPLWRDTPTPYGPLWLAIEGGAAGIAHGNLIVVVTVLRLVAVFGALLCVAAAGQLSAAKPLLTSSPLILIHVVSGAHNDILLAGLVLAGLAIAKRFPHAAFFVGTAMGLAAAVKFTALAAAPFALLMIERNGKRIIWFTSGLIGAYAVPAVLTGHGLGFVHALGSTGSMVQWLSLPTGIGMAVGYLLRVAGAPGSFGAAVATARLVGLAALAATLLGLWRWARSAPTHVAIRAVTAAGLALLAVAVLGPVFYAWYAIGGLVLLSAVPLAGRLRTMVQIAAVVPVFLTLPDSLGLATKTKVPGAFLDVALVVLGIAWWLRRRLPRRTSPTPPALRSAAPSPAPTDRRPRRTAPSSADR